LKTQGILW